MVEEIKFMKTYEAKPLRIKNAWNEGIKFLEKNDYNRAWLAARTICLEDPNSVEGNLLHALVDYHKSKVLNSPYFLVNCKQYCEKVLKKAPRNREALKILRAVEELEQSGVDISITAEYDEFLGKEPVAFKDCQIGYHPESEKSVVIWTLKDYPCGKFVVLNTITGKKVYCGTMKRHRAYAWKRYWWTADFSSIKKDGTYLLRVYFPDGTKAESHQFDINKNVYLKMLRLSLQGFFNHRCGQKLPWRNGCNDGPILYQPAPGCKNWHAPDEDNLVKLNEPAKITKGWHDGGNWERHSTNIVTNLYCLLLGHWLAPRKWFFLGGPLPDALEEARYTVEFFLSAVDERGNANVSTHVSGIKQAEDGRFFLTQMYLAYSDPKIHHYYRHPDKSTWIPWYTRLFAAAIAKFAIMVKQQEPKNAEKCIDAAIKMHNFYKSPDAGENFTVSVYGTLALSALNIAHYTGSEEYREEARIHIERILNYQEKDGFFPASGIEASAIYLAGFYPQIALFEYAEIFPDDPLRKKIENSYKRFMPWIERLTGCSPFGHMMEYKKVRPRNLVTAINGHGTNAYFGYVAIVCFLANRILKTHRYTKIAERQIQWLFGRNPVGVSFMGGSGYRSSSQHLADLFDNKSGLKQIPGFMPLGLRGIEVPGLGNDYPYFRGFDVDGYGNGYSIGWSTCEGGGMTQGPVFAALSLLSAERN
ncbi:MAG: glycoside hydrolase family 9 protein [bacterium]|nr:glycoside hydrolase family 9 protein [bacterium]